jgi:hypothetical protein
MDSHANSREITIARTQFMNTLNGTRFEQPERRDCELFYMKQVYKDFLAMTNQTSIPSVEIPELAAFTSMNHPRFYELVEKFGSPVDMVSLQKEGTNISNSTAKVTLVSECENTLDKQLTKKLLLTMTVAELKSLCSKLFKAEALYIQLVYREEGYEEDYELDEAERALSFFSIKDGGKIIVKEI